MKDSNAQKEWYKNKERQDLIITERVGQSLKMTDLQVLGAHTRQGVLGFWT